MVLDRDGVAERWPVGGGKGEMERVVASSTNGGALGLLPEPGDGSARVPWPGDPPPGAASDCCDPCRRAAPEGTVGSARICCAGSDDEREKAGGLAPCGRPLEPDKLGETSAIALLLRALASESGEKKGGPVKQRATLAS